MINHSKPVKPEVQTKINVIFQGSSPLPQTVKKIILSLEMRESKYYSIISNSVPLGGA